MPDTISAQDRFLAAFDTYLDEAGVADALSAATTIFVSLVVSYTEARGGACGSGHHGHPRIEGETGWCLDHCHASGKIRGVLCWRCNLALGYAGDSPDALRALAAYIESHHGVNAAKNIARFGLESLAVGAPA